MKKVLFVLLVIIFLIVIISLIFSKISKLTPIGVGALQVITNVKSQVYLDGKFIGETPLCKCKAGDTINEGEYLLNIVPEDKNINPFSYKIKVDRELLTAIDREFLPGPYASAYILNLEKLNEKEPQILITSTPDGALVLFDGQPIGITPLFLRDIPKRENEIEGLEKDEHEVELNKDGFTKKVVIIKTNESYKLVAHMILGAFQKEKITDKSLETIDKTSTASSELDSNVQIKIKDTPTGFLRVRESASTSSKETNRVKPGETYVLLEETEGWFKIKLNDENQGWISSNFSEKVIIQ